MTWDFDNRMVDADVGNNSSVDVSHKYDALGRRVARTEDTTTTIFVQFGQQTICDYPVGGDPALSIYRYLYASYIDEPVMRWETAEDDPVYYHRNQQYSIVAVTADTGDIVERYSYTAYGVPTFFDGSGSPISDSAFSNRYTYTGREYDSIVRLSHYRARMYDPQLGRFLGRDPIGYEDGPSLYRAYFVPADLDPSGLKGPWDPRDPRKDPHFPYPRVPSQPPTPNSCPTSSEVFAHIAFLYLMQDTQCIRGVVPPEKNNPFQHCVWQCRLSRATDVDIAQNCALQKEHVDYAICQYARSLSRACFNTLSPSAKTLLADHCYSAFQPSDFEDNKAGRDCADSHYDLDCYFFVVEIEMPCETCCMRTTDVHPNTPEGPGTKRPCGPYMPNWLEPYRTKS